MVEVIYVTPTCACSFWSSLFKSSSSLHENRAINQGYCPVNNKVQKADLKQAVKPLTVSVSLTAIFV